MVSEVLSLVSEDEGEFDSKAVMGYHKMRRKVNGI